MIGAVVFPIATALLTAILVLSASALVIIVFLVIAPWRTIREEPPLPEEVETRLLLGQDFKEIEERLADQDDTDRPALSDLDRSDHPE